MAKPSLKTIALMLGLGILPAGAQAMSNTDHAMAQNTAKPSAPAPMSAGNKTSASKVFARGTQRPVRDIPRAGTTPPGASPAETAGASSPNGSPGMRKDTARQSGQGASP